MRISDCDLFLVALDVAQIKRAWLKRMGTRDKTAGRALALIGGHEPSERNGERLVCDNNEAQTCVSTCVCGTIRDLCSALSCWCRPVSRCDNHSPPLSILKFV